jgi:uncharacterized protein YihD (DUF1040 family)|tara:strand:- start:439 stop:1155 length:717 start_codon:yes stop_codon:yes gene_type:complete
MVYSDKEILDSFEQYKDELLSFFNRISKEYGFNKKQTKILFDSVKHLVYFLKMDKTERIEAEIQFNEENRSKIKDKLTRLKKFYSANKDLVDEIAPSREKERFHNIIKRKIKSLEKNLKIESKERAGSNKAVIFELRELFYRLDDFEFPRTKQIDLVYELFKEFDFDDYGKEYHTKDTIIGELEQKERIRKHFQAKILQEYEQFISFKKYMDENRERIFNTPESKEARDLIFGNSRLK